MGVSSRSCRCRTAFLPNAAGTRGVRQNLGFESAGIAPERALPLHRHRGRARAGRPARTVGAGSPARILRYDLKQRRLDRQYVYWTDPIAEPPVPATQFAVNGLVELLPLNNEFLLAMERSFSVGAPDTGNTIKLYNVALPRRRRRQRRSTASPTLLGGDPAGRRSRCCSTSTPSGSRSTTSRA